MTTSYPSITLKQYYDNANTIYNFWLSNGFTKEQACGLLTQADAESSLNPYAKGDKDKVTNEYKAFGLYQLHTDRVALIKTHCGIDMTTETDVTKQLQGVLWELNHSEKKALNEIKKANTAYMAAFAACKYYERPGAIGQADKRGIKAGVWFEYFTEKEPKPS
jgi:ATP/maltotriose-dependent transcriptional regulator MalT